MNKKLYKFLPLTILFLGACTCASSPAVFFGLEAPSSPQPLNLTPNQVPASPQVEVIVVEAPAAEPCCETSPAPSSVGTGTANTGASYHGDPMTGYMGPTDLEGGVRVWIDDVGANGSGQSMIFYGDQIWLDQPWWGHISFIEVAPNWEFCAYFIADENFKAWLGQPLCLSTGKWNLQRIHRNPSQTPWNVANDCELGYTTCASDSIVAFQTWDP